MVPILIFPATIAQAGASLEPIQERQIFQVDEEFRVEANVVRQNFETGVVIAEGNVKVWYGQTELNSPRLELDQANKIGKAYGGVVVYDPEGLLKASEVEFDWSENKSGIARNAVVEIGRTRLKAGKAFIMPEGWLLEDVEFSLDELKALGFSIRARELKLDPGTEAVGRRVVFDLFGLGLGPVPRFSFSLNDRGTGFQLPSLRNQEGIGLGVGWEAAFQLNQKQFLATEIGVFPELAPNLQLRWSYTPLSVEESPYKIAPRSDLVERFNDGWFNNIKVKDPENEKELYRRHKLVYSIGTSWNYSTVARVVDSTSVSKLFDLSVEGGENFGGVGVRGTVRAQRIRGLGSSPWLNRGVAMVSAYSPIYEKGDMFGIGVRGDLFGTASERNQFGFARGELGVFGRPIEGVTLGVAYALGAEFGTADFGFDKLGRDSTFMWRADYRRGPYTLRYLAKYDTIAKDWYDREWEIALAAGSFEPFISRREFPQDYRIGVRFRLDSFFQGIRQREIGR